jgi:SPP1 gp7 family putative phage head morphogenesis protein
MIGVWVMLGVLVYALIYSALHPKPPKRSRPRLSIPPPPPGEVPIARIVVPLSPRRNRGRRQIINDLVENVRTGQVSRDSFRKELQTAGIEMSRNSAELILHHRLSKLYADKTWRDYQNPEFRNRYPYLGLTTAHDSRVHPNHFALDVRRIKTVFPMDDMIWTVMRPPLGRTCRCSVLAYSDEDVSKRGWSVGRGEDWYGKQVEVELPDGRIFDTFILPDSEMRRRRLPLATLSKKYTLVPFGKLKTGNSFMLFGIRYTKTSKLKAEDEFHVRHYFQADRQVEPIPPSPPL